MRRLIAYCQVYFFVFFDKKSTVKSTVYSKKVQWKVQ